VVLTEEPDGGGGEGGFFEPERVFHVCAGLYKCIKK
jgi:hypothetical protein